MCTRQPEKQFLWINKDLDSPQLRSLGEERSSILSFVQKHGLNARTKRKDRPHLSTYDSVAFKSGVYEKTVNCDVPPDFASGSMRTRWRLHARKRDAMQGGKDRSHLGQRVPVLDLGSVRKSDCSLSCDTNNTTTMERDGTNPARQYRSQSDHGKSSDCTSISSTVDSGDVNAFTSMTLVRSRHGKPANTTTTKAKKKSRGVITREKPGLCLVETSNQFYGSLQPKNTRIGSPRTLSNLSTVTPGQGWIDPFPTYPFDRELGSIQYLIDHGEKCVR